MNQSHQSNTPDLIVIGEDETGKPRAARFSAAQSPLVTKAAGLMGLTVCPADTDALIELSKRLPIGRLYANGRGMVPNVRRDLYGKLVEHAKLAGHAVGRATATDPSAAGLPANWTDIQPGHLIIAQEDGGVKEGWWEAVVLARDGDMLTLKWRDYPKQSHVTRHIAAVALLNPTPASH